MEETKIYTFIICDEGQVKEVFTDCSLQGLIQTAEYRINLYLADNGYDGEVELMTEDGYVKIVSTIIACHEEEEHIWSYSFDGEETVSDALLRVNRE